MLLYFDRLFLFIHLNDSHSVQHDRAAAKDKSWNVPIWTCRKNWSALELLDLRAKQLAPCLWSAKRIWIKLMVAQVPLTANVLNGPRQALISRLQSPSPSIYNMMIVISHISLLNRQWLVHNINTISFLSISHLENGLNPFYFARFKGLVELFWFFFLPSSHNRFIATLWGVQGKKANSGGLAWSASAQKP